MIDYHEEKQGERGTVVMELSDTDDDDEERVDNTETLVLTDG